MATPSLFFFFSKKSNFHKINKKQVSPSSENASSENARSTVYHKFSGNKIIFLVLYVDDILLVLSDLGLLHEVK